MAEEIIKAQAADEGPEIEFYRKKVAEEKKVAVQEEESGDVQFSGEYLFHKPLEFEGRTYEFVKYDLTALKARDVITAKNEAFRIRKQVSTDSLMTDDLLHAVLFARAADLPGGVVLELSAQDYAAWSTVAQLFFASALSGMIAQ